LRLLIERFLQGVVAPRFRVKGAEPYDPCARLPTDGVALQNDRRHAVDDLGADEVGVTVGFFRASIGSLVRKEESVIAFLRANDATHARQGGQDNDGDSHETALQQNTLQLSAPSSGFDTSFRAIADRPRRSKPLDGRELKSLAYAMVAQTDPVTGTDNADLDGTSIIPDAATPVDR